MKSLQNAFRLSLCFFMMLAILPANAQRITGSGDVIKEDRSLSGFHSIEVSDGVDVYIEQGNKESVVVRADDNLVNMIETKVVGETLVIDAKGSYRKSKAFEVFVTLKDLNRLEAYGGSDVYGLSEMQLDELEIVMKGGSDLEMEITAQKMNCTLRGASDAQLKGSVDHLIVDARGASDLEAKRLIVNVCELEMSGASDAEVTVKEEIDAKASGSSDIYYRGNPKIVRQKAKGSSEIHGN